MMSSDIVSLITGLEERLAQAWVERDRHFIEGLLAAEWRVIDPAGRVLTRQEVLDETFGSTERRIDSMVVDEVAVTALGEVAIATGRTRATGSYRGQQGEALLRFTMCSICATAAGWWSRRRAPRSLRDSAGLPGAAVRVGLGLPPF